MSLGKNTVADTKNTLAILQEIIEAFSNNFELKEKLKPEHIKTRILGHWGTVPGLNFIYANLNYLVWKHKCEMLLVTGPGHGAPAILANLFAEKTLGDFYPGFQRDGKGMGRLIHDFSWPHTTFPSHVTPSVPGSILEGGELGYSLATAYGFLPEEMNWQRPVNFLAIVILPKVKSIFLR